MLLIPLTGKNILKNPPVVTISLILINCLVFFLFQSGDTAKKIEAEKYYFESHLAEIELARYIQYLNAARNDQAEIPDLAKLDQEKIVELHWRMMLDKKFFDELKNDKIITPENPEYDQWKDLRKTYEQLRAKVVSITYGFTPGAPAAVSLFTYMFLHGSVGHLIGNMIFLWLSGCLLEMGTRRTLYCFTYLFTGICAVSLFWLFNLNSMIPLVGASGAIAGLMGAFSVLFGRKKIRVFYSLGFYFNYVKAPAILLLPLWIANEFYQLFFSGDAQVAYMAHIGGLISGGAISFINQKWIGAVNLESFEEESEDRVSPLIEKALAHVEKLKLEKGAKLLEEALALDPENKSVMIHLFNVRKMNPKTPEFHAISRKLISWLILKNDDQAGIVKTFMEYRKLAGSTKLSPDIYLKLSTIFIDSGQMKQAEGLLAGLLKKHPDLAGLSTAVLRLAKGYEKSGLLENRQKCLKIIRRKFPGSAEAAIATKSLS